MEALLSLFKQRSEFSIEVGFPSYFSPHGTDSTLFTLQYSQFFRHFLLVDDAGLQVYSYEVCALVPSFLVATYTNVLWALPLPQSLVISLLVIFDCLESYSKHSDNSENSKNSDNSGKRSKNENSDNSDHSDNGDKGDTVTTETKVTRVTQ